jgi:hypothetical protein
MDATDAKGISRQLLLFARTCWQIVFLEDSTKVIRSNQVAEQAISESDLGVGAHQKTWSF